MNFRKAAEHLDGLAAANVNEPSEGDLERVLKNQSRLQARVKELEGMLQQILDEGIDTSTDGGMKFVRDALADGEKK